MTPPTAILDYAPTLLKYSVAISCAVVACAAAGLYAFQLAMICKFSVTLVAPHS